MYSEINKKMEDARQGSARLHKINSIIECLEKDKKNLNEKVIKLKSILKKENNDVEKLERKSIASYFYSITGTIDKHIEKEQQ